MASGTLERAGGQDQLRCYGTKITIEGTVELDGTAYESGTLLTVDKDLEWIEVSGWD